MGHENRVWAAASEHLLYGWRGILWNEILSLLDVKFVKGMGPDEPKTRRSSSASKSWVASDQSEPTYFASY